MQASILGRLALLLVLVSSFLPAQSLLFSTSVDTSGSFPVADEDILSVNPGSGTRPFLMAGALNALVGDGNGDGVWADGPTDIDALDIGATGDITSMLFSATATFSSAAGPVLDGDVFALDGQGAVMIVHHEAFFESITGTTGIDVDAIARGASGELYFSFAEDEVTSDPTLSAQNGGSTLDEQTVFLWIPGQPTAIIHLTKDQVVAAFNQALGTNVTSIVDTTGVALDPFGQNGDLLLVSGSTSQSLAGFVVSTRQGGVLFDLGGTPSDPTLFSLQLPRLDALTVSFSTPHVLFATESALSSGTGGFSDVRVHGFGPSEVVQLVVTEPRAVAPFADPLPGTLGFGLSYVDPFHPLFAQSFSVTPWTLLTDAFGEARFRFSYTGLPVGVQAIVQAVSLPGLVLTNPTALHIVP